MTSIKSKVKSAVKNYARNVVGGAKVVSSAVKSAVSNASKNSQGASAMKFPLNKGASLNTIKPVQKPLGTINGKTYYPAGQKEYDVARKGQIIKSGSTGIVSTLASQNKVQGAISGFSNKLNQRSSGISGGSNRSSNNIGSTSISANGSLNPNMTGTSDFSGSSNFLSPAGQTGLGSNVSSVPTSSVSTMNTLNANEMRPTPDITLPTEKTISESPTIAPVVTPETQPQEKDALTTYLEGLNEIERPSSADAYLKAQRETGILQKQQAVNDLSSQLNAIVNKGQASQLSLVGQGRGIPEAIIGGQQAQIGRETAIAALPVQAQLQAAQGNLEMANDNLDTLFKMYSDDAKNEYEYRREVKKAIYEHASAKEKRALEKADKLEEREYQKGENLRKEVNDYAKVAMANNQGSLGAKLSKLAQNVNSPTFQEDYANLISKIYDPAKALDLDLKKEALTKARAENAALSGNTDATSVALKSDIATKLLNEKVGLKLAVGTGTGRGLFRTSGKRIDFVNNTEQILNILTLDSFAQAKAKGMTFGAMSEAEWNILSSSANPIANARVYTGSLAKGTRKVVGYNMREKTMEDWLKTLANPEEGYLNTVDKTLSTNDSLYGKAGY